LPTQPNSHRLRFGRHSEIGRAYLITAVIHNRQPLFSDWRLGRLLVAEMRRAHDSGRVNSIAWVVMPDHFHWLMQLQDDKLGNVMGATKARCAQAVNKTIGRRGTLWQTGYHDRAIRDGEELLPFARYIVAKPLRAGLVDKIGDYPLWDACWLLLSPSFNDCRNHCGEGICWTEDLMTQRFYVARGFIPVRLRSSRRPCGSDVAERTPGERFALQRG
jgi:putative transposase